MKVIYQVYLDKGSSARDCETLYVSTWEEAMQKIAPFGCSFSSVTKKILLSVDEYDSLKTGKTMTQFKDKTFDEDITELVGLSEELQKKALANLREALQSALDDLDAGKLLEFDAERIKAECRKIKEAKDEPVSR